jgi:hypothetical protein
MATIVSSSNDFGLKLCEILKLDPRKTRTITIISPMDDFVHVTVEQMLVEDEAEELIKVLMKFQYVEDGKNR